MRWPWKSDESKDAAGAAVPSPTSSSSASTDSSPSSASSFSQLPPIKQLVSWTDSLNKTDWQHYKDPQAWAPPVLAVGAALGFSAFYRSYLRRIPSTNHIQPRFFRRRSLLGRVTSVGDGDNFHLYHTPGGWLAGWGWLRKVPSYRKDLKGKTIPVRIAGVDAPECAHFGRPAQPYSGEALDFLTSYLLGRRVRIYLYRRDQYDRVVARVMVRRFFFFRRDVGLAMLKRGLATCYEAKTGAEFGDREAQYRVAEVRARARKRGLWAGGSGKGDIETPREFKTRMAAADAEKEVTTATTSTSTSTSTSAAAVAAPKSTPPAVLPTVTKPIPAAVAAPKPTLAVAATPAATTSHGKPAAPPAGKPALSSGTSSAVTSTTGATTTATSAAANLPGTSSPSPSLPGSTFWAKSPVSGAKL